MTLTALVEYYYGNDSHGPNMIYPEENGHLERGNWTWEVLPLLGRFGEVDGVIRHYFVSPFEMFGILAEETMNYIGVEHEELGSGR